MSEHTPGPCFAEEGTPHVYKRWNDHVVILATVKDPTWHEDRHCAAQEAFANAVLYAAAPDLLAIFTDVLNAFWDMSPLEFARSKGLDSISDADGEAILDQARAIIAKANGE